MFNQRLQLQLCIVWYAFCSYVISELIQTEKLYVEDLAQIVLVSIVCHSVSSN